MARDPGSVWAPLPEAGAPDGYAKTQFIVHSTGDNGTAKATARYFGGVTPNESTFIIGWGPWDPTLQIMDSTDRADANVSASVRAIAVEVVGDGVDGFNAWQRSEIIRIGRWARKEHPGILPRIIPTHTEAGYGWHIMFGAPGPWAGVAKSCPGPDRIRELQNDIFPAIFAGQEDDMSAEAERQISEMYQELTKGRASRAFGDDGKPVTYTGRALEYAVSADAYSMRAAQEATAARKEIAGLRAAVDKLATAVAAGDPVNAEELRAVISEEMAKVVQVEVSIVDRPEPATGSVS